VQAISDDLQDDSIPHVAAFMRAACSNYPEPGISDGSRAA